MNVFLDTNILVYAYDTSDEAKHKIALDLIAHLLSAENVVISTQVLNEFVVVITGKVKHPLSIDDVSAILKKFKDNFAIRLTGMPDITKALSITKKFKLSYWDSLIIAVAINTRCTTLYSEDLQHGLEIDNTLRIINPFK
jgi:predicted nucleic acid-binding protein